MSHSKTRKSAAGKRRTLNGRFRIISGSWRGRRFEFPTQPGLRPTPDRVRETLFNWLQPVLPGAVCLDLFAGSGSLGLEALSRGAGETVFVELNRKAATAIESHLAALDCTRGKVITATAADYVAQCAGHFDAVFLDPPFDWEGMPDLCERIEARGLLKPGAHIYLEMRASRGEPVLPAGWRMVRSKRAGQVGYHLASRDRNGADVS